MNRTQSPDFKTNFDITFQQAQHKTLGNGCAVHYIQAGSQELVKIDFEFYAGTAFQTKPLTASFTNRLLKEGTSKHSSKQIADIIDFYGAFLETDCGNDTASVTLYALNKHLEHLIPLVYEIMFDATFPDNEFETYRTNALQKYYTRQKKVSDVASAKFGEMLYGGSNFYGYKVEESDYKNLQVDEIRTFYKQFYKFNLKETDNAVTGFNISIFSKYPIVNSGYVERLNDNGNCTIFSDILFKNDTIRIISTHLKSIAFDKNDFKTVAQINESNENTKINYLDIKNIGSKLKNAFINRSKQAEAVRKFIDESKKCKEQYED
jgi:hypothetical protein